MNPPATAARDAARKARAIAFLREKPKAGKPWASKPYVYDREPTSEQKSNE